MYKENEQHKQEGKDPEKRGKGRLQQPWFADPFNSSTLRIQQEEFKDWWWRKMLSHLEKIVHSDGCRVCSLQVLQNCNLCWILMIDQLDYWNYERAKRLIWTSSKMKKFKFINLYGTIIIYPRAGFSGQFWSSRREITLKMINYNINNYVYIYLKLVSVTTAEKTPSSRKIIFHKYGKLIKRSCTVARSNKLWTYRQTISYVFPQTEGSTQTYPCRLVGFFQRKCQPLITNIKPHNPKHGEFWLFYLIVSTLLNLTI